MDRRSFIKTAGLATSGALIGAPAVAKDNPEIHWRCQSSFGVALDALLGAAKLFAERVATATDGRFQIEMVPAGPDQIVPALGVADAVSNGVIEMCQTASYYFVAKDPTFALGTAIPFGFNARHFNAWMTQAGGNELMNAFYGKFGIVALLGGNSGAQMGGWYRKEIFSVDDLKGLKMRISGLGGQIMQRLGVETKQLSGDDTVKALAAGEIDAAEWVGPYDDEKLGLNKAAPYYYPGFWEGEAGVHYFIAAAKWAGLPPAYQAVLTAAAAESNNWMLTRYDARNALAFRRLIDAGVQVKPFTRDILDAAYRASLDVYATISSGNADFAAIYDHMMAFRAQILPWFEVCEYPFDSYIYSMIGRG